VLGEVEDERYVGVALYQGVPKGKRKAKVEFAMGQEMVVVRQAEPTVVACALHRARYYLFTRREPVDTDDAALVRGTLRCCSHACVTASGNHGAALLGRVGARMHAVLCVRDPSCIRLPGMHGIQCMHDPPRTRVPCMECWL
jgi:hypothetical protein